MFTILLNRFLNSFADDEKIMKIYREMDDTDIQNYDNTVKDAYKKLCAYFKCHPGFIPVFLHDVVHSDVSISQLNFYMTRTGITNIFGLQHEHAIINNLLFIYITYAHNANITQKCAFVEYVNLEQVKLDIENTCRNNNVEFLPEKINAVTNRINIGLKDKTCVTVFNIGIAKDFAIEKFMSLFNSNEV